MRVKVTTICLIGIVFNLHAQCNEWNWPPDRKLAEEKVALLQDAMANKKYRQALLPFNWIVTHAPQLNYGIYVHGTNIYEALANREKDINKRKNYIDSLLIIYDLRIKFCGDEANVLGRKALDAFQFLINGPDSKRVLPLMDSLLVRHGKLMSDAVLLPCMQTMVINHQKFKLPDVEFILSRYDMLASVIEDKVKLAATDAKRKAKLLKIKRDIDDWLLKVVKPDCDFVRSNLAPRLVQNPNDMTMVKQIFSYLLQGKCTDDPLWIKTAKILFREEKDFTIGKSLAYRYLSVDSLSLATDYLEQALAVAPSKNDSSEIIFYQGSLASKLGDKSGARDLFLKAVKLDNNRKEAYERIGDLYMGSFNECAQKQRQADDRAIYIAAFTYYLKAGNQRKASLAKQSFPSKEDIFVVNYRAGDKIKVQCWVNEEVILQTRD